MFIDNKINRRVIIIKKQIAIICSCLLVIVPILILFDLVYVHRNVFEKLTH